MVDETIDSVSKNLDSNLESSVNDAFRSFLEKREEPVRILLVEDSEFNQRVFIDYFETHFENLRDNYEIEVAASGQEFVEKVIKSTESGKGFDFAIVDQRLPDVPYGDFLSFLERSVSSEESGSDFNKFLENTQWVLSSAYEAEDDTLLETLTDKFHMSGEFAKPYDLQKVIRFAFLRSGITSGSDNLQAAKKKFDTELRRLGYLDRYFKVVHIDDDPVSRHVMSDYFKELFTGLNFSYFVADSIVEAVELIPKSEPELVFWDFNLDSGTNCVDAINRLRQMRMDGNIGYNIDDSLQFIITGEEHIGANLLKYAYSDLGIRSRISKSSLSAQILVDAMVEQFRYKKKRDYIELLNRNRFRYFESRLEAFGHTMNNRFCPTFGNLSLADIRIRNLKEELKSSGGATAITDALIDQAAEYIQKSFHCAEIAAKVIKEFRDSLTKSTKPDYFDLRDALQEGLEKLRFVYRNTAVQFSADFPSGPSRDYMLFGFKDGFRTSTEDTGDNSVQGKATEVSHKLILDINGGGECIKWLISDNGTGIEPKNLSLVFKDGFTTRKGNTGKGLYILKETIDIHGGKLKCESALGSGTTFCSTLYRNGV